MFKAFREHIKQHLPYLQEHSLLIACSGGVDSTVLVDLCHRAGMRCELAHCNFQLRGTASDEDEKFVEMLGIQYQFKYHIKHFETTIYQKVRQLSTQMAARELRYHWFRELAQIRSLKYILTAHHNEDNLETFLINLGRGSGWKGLTGIPEQNGNIVRPLLPFSRKQIIRYARKHSIQWREDQTNQSTEYLRNSIRHRVTAPLIQSQPGFLNNFKRTLKYLQFGQELITNHIRELRHELFQDTNASGQIFIPIEKLRSLQPQDAYIYELFYIYGFESPREIQKLYTSQSGKLMRSSTHRLIKNREDLILEPLHQTKRQVYKIHSGEKALILPDSQLIFSNVATIEEVEKNIAYVDRDALKFPLVVRKAKAGDYFYPFGMQGKKKISKFYKDEKLSLPQKENTWLVCSADTVVWIIGHRLDDRFKITEQTKTILKIRVLYP